MINPLQDNLNKTIKAVLIFILLLGAGSLNFVLAASESPEQVQRSQEILREDKMLRERIEKDAGVFIKEIIVEGAEGLSEDKINEVILPYLNRRLRQNDIAGLLVIVRQMYVDAGHKATSFYLRHEIKGPVLEIIIRNSSGPVKEKEGVVL
ncbi:MAG: POTRA domain-containing protein [Candidatus Omnitrophota bacterium]